MLVIGDQADVGLCLRVLGARWLGETRGGSVVVTLDALDQV